MTLLTSGNWNSTTQRGITGKVYDFMCEKFPQISTVDIEVHQKDLREDGVFGWCEVDEDGEYFIQIHNKCLDDVYVTTLIHELVHVKQTIGGLLDDERREEEADIWEKILRKEYFERECDKIHVVTASPSPLFP